MAELVVVVEVFSFFHPCQFVIYWNWLHMRREEGEAEGMSVASSTGKDCVKD